MLLKNLSIKKKLLLVATITLLALSALVANVLIPYNISECELAQLVFIQYAGNNDGHESVEDLIDDGIIYYGTRGPHGIFDFSKTYRLGIVERWRGKAKGKYLEYDLTRTGNMTGFRKMTVSLEEIEHGKRELKKIVCP